jgi:flagellar basal body-associated protein FliL
MTNKKGAIKVVQAMIDQIKEDINLLSNNGKNVNDIFTNKFYINDYMQDRQIVEEINS